MTTNQMGSRNRFIKRNDSFSFAPPAGGSLSTEGRRAARRSAGTRRSVTPAAATATGSVVRMGGEEYNMDDPEQRTAYDTAQKTELDRQGPMADIRGGAGLADTGSRMAPAPVDPNNTGAKGTSMKYGNVVGRMEDQYGIKVRNAFEAENLPGTASYGASFALNSGENQRSFGESMAASQASDLNISSSAMRNAAEEGIKSAELESQRQLTPGEQNFGEDQVKLEIADRSSATSPEARKRASRAFLDADDSMSGLRAAEAEMGIVHAAGRKFAKNPDAEGGEVEITKDQYRARMRGGSMAQAIKDNPVISAAKGKATARKAVTGVDSQTAATEAPSDVENPFVIGRRNEFDVIDNSSAMHGARTNFNTDVKMPNWFGKDLNTDSQMFGL